jgi:hypothetical protein
VGGERERRGKSKLSGRQGREAVESLIGVGVGVLLEGEG